MEGRLLETADCLQYKDNLSKYQTRPKVELVSHGRQTQERSYVVQPWRGRALNPASPPRQLCDLGKSVDLANPASASVKRW